MNEVIGYAMVAKALSELIQKLNRSPDLAKDLKALNMELIVIQTHALSAFQEVSSLREQVTTLRAELKTLLDWDEEASHYTAREVGTGVFAYIGKDEKSPFKSALKLCCNCFVDRKKTILQLQRGEFRKPMLVCQRGHASLTFTSWMDSGESPEGIAVA